MATKTNNLGLSKAELTDAIRSTLVANNGNFDILDSTYVSMQEQINRLKANQITGMASGTEIVVEDSAEMESILKISGNSEQDSRSGKNLLKKDSNYVTTTSDGITFTINEDESVTINGKNNGNYNSAVYLWRGGSNNPLHFPAGTYKASTTGFTDLTITGYTGSTYTTLSTKNNNQFTLDSDTDFQSVYIQVARGSGDTYNNYTIYPIVTKSTDSVEPYEPYGAMPSPDYPSEIRSVKSKSDNLLPFSDKTFEISGINFICANGNLVLNGTSTAEIYSNSQLYKDNFTFTLSAGTYSYQANLGGLSDYNIPCYIKKKSDDSTIISINGADTRSAVFTLTEETELYLGLYIYQKTLSNVNLYLMINKGDKALPYQPYGYVPVEVKVEGENVEPKIISLPLGDIELRSVPSGARDTFVKKDGVWNKYEKVGAFIITQDMFNNFYPTQYGLPMANFKVPNIVSSWKSGDALFTSYKELKGGENPITSCFSTARSNVAFEIFDERFTDAETAKNLMNGETGITELKTFNYIPVTDETLIQALDELEQLILHKGYNRITVTSVNGVKAYLDLSYIKDINAVLDNINAIILTLGGGANV